jgi:SAM-dependent methyltransferase
MIGPRPARPPGPHGSGLAGGIAAFDTVVVEEDRIAVRGWLVGLQHPIDRVRLVVDGAVVGEMAVFEREDVGRHFAEIAHAARSGFDIAGARPGNAGPLRIELIGSSGGRDLVINEHYRPASGAAEAVLPPAHLIWRVTNNPDEALFRDYGLTIAAQLLHAVRTHLPPTEAPRLLDWGCGPGRATQHLFALWPQAQVSGCDLDAEAIAWARERMPGGSFHVTGAYPPLPFADGAFDAVIASSVMTHLTAAVQLDWLREIRRVLRPGGVFVASVHGPFAARGIDAARAEELRRTGIVDWGPDPSLDGIAPDNFYRATLQTIDYTYAAWGAVMPVVAYQEAGLTSFQDLVVLRHEPADRNWLRRLWR